MTSLLSSCYTMLGIVKIVQKCLAGLLLWQPSFISISRVPLPRAIRKKNYSNIREAPNTDSRLLDM
jgi:hypothetical protein